MSGEAHAPKFRQGWSHENKKEPSGNCPDKKKVNGKTDYCSRKEHCEKSNVYKDCVGQKKKAKEGSGHVNEPLTKEEQERLDNQQFFIGTGNRHYYVKAIGAKVSPYYNVQLLITEGRTRSLNTIRIKDAGHFIGTRSLVEIEAASSTWLKLEESELPADGKTGMIDILISGTLENHDRAKTMINKILEESELPADGKTGMIDILISGTLENHDRAKTMINKIVSQ
nr:hypothetical protein [Tanacetum cinerariifolium]